MDLTDDNVTAILGEKCPVCGWRGGRHRPAVGRYEACPHWVPEPDDES
jgi:hypothetical protein